jgi:hypothetical protein
MNIITMIYAVGSSGIFPSRAFVPAFVTALILRFGSHLPILAGTGLVPKNPVNCWFTSDLAIVIMGVLALLELLATRNEGVRQMLDRVDHVVKPGVAALTTVGVLSATDAEVIQAIQQAGVGCGALAGFVAALVYWIGLWRKAVWNFLVDIDADDSLGLQELFGWVEEGWAFFGVVMLIVFPIVMLILTGIAMLILHGIHRALEHREESKRVPCASCQAMIYPCAVACPACKARVAQPCTVGFFGQSKPATVANVETLPAEMAEKRRCPVCASRLPKHTPHQTCPVCGRQPFADSAFAARYDATVLRRGWRVLPLCFAFGLLPGLGVVPGVLYYRHAWVAPYRRYVPPLRSMVTRWIIRIVCFVLLMIQWVPVLGWISLPLMALVNHLFFRRAFRTVLTAGPG